MWLTVINEHLSKKCFLQSEHVHLYYRMSFWLTCTIGLHNSKQEKGLAFFKTQDDVYIYPHIVFSRSNQNVSVWLISKKQTLVG